MEVTFVRWLKAAGDTIEVGDPLFEVDTEKSVMVVEAYAAGTLAEATASEGDIVAPRDVIGRILAPGEPAQAMPSSPSAPTTPELPSPAGESSGAVNSSSAAPVGASGTTPAASRPAGTRRGGISPRARRVAAKLGVAVDRLHGSGPDGLITETDVRAAAEVAPAAAAPSEPADEAKRERSRQRGRSPDHVSVAVDPAFLSRPRSRCRGRSCCGQADAVDMCRGGAGAGTTSRLQSGLGWRPTRATRGR